jgi:hypothetical protein
MTQYDSIIKYIPDKDSKDSEWITWHKMLVKGYGRDRANDAFTVAFSYLASSSAKTNDLRAYGKTVGLDLDTNLSQDAARIVKTVKSSVGGVFSSIGGIFKTTRTVIIIVIILCLVPVFMLLFNVARKPGEVIGTAAKVYTGGKVPAIK